MDQAALRNLTAQLLALHAQAQTLTQQTVAITTQVEAALHLIESAAPVTPEVTNANGECQHPVEKRRDTSTYGLRRFRCTVCLADVAGETKAAGG